MLFNSFEFIFYFLPITTLVFWLIGPRVDYRGSILWLIGCSLFFYGWWNPAYLFLLIFSVLFNYFIGLKIAGNLNNTNGKLLLILGVCVNLGLLGYFKYVNFIIGNMEKVLNKEYQLDPIILPLAISFFTFQQISFLTDSYQGKTREYSLIHYFLFVTFFPQLIAGPIVHHKEMLPQFMKKMVYRFNLENLNVGLSIFFMGLFKKVVLGDGIAGYAASVFSVVEGGGNFNLFEAWAGALAFTFQIYFDFSGYSDMAIGLARIFGIRLPNNFNSPYKAKNIIGFWRRWHITLSRFLRDYLYIPLGGKRRGEFRRYGNIMITMLLGGLWHGAGWTFIVWGGLHGIYLLVNHAWRSFSTVFLKPIRVSRRMGDGISVLLTFLGVVVGWVFFRAETFDGAIRMLRTMFGGEGVSMPKIVSGNIGSLEPWLFGKGVRFSGIFENEIISTSVFTWLLISLVIVWALPNTQQIMIRYKPVFEVYPGETTPGRWSVLEWFPGRLWALGFAAIAIISILRLSHVAEFIYFQF